MQQGHPEQVFGFYDAVLSALGYRLERKSERGFDWNLQSPLGVHSIGLVKANSQGRSGGMIATRLGCTM